MDEIKHIDLILLNKLYKQPGFKLPLYMEKFGALKTNLDRVNFVYEELKKHDAFPPFKHDEKSDVWAVMYREDGNKHFKRSHYRKSLYCYTTSVMLAKSKEVLALAYGNRSAVFSRLNMPTECLIDIARALQNGYPEHLKPKLIARQKHSKTQRGVKTEPYEKIGDFNFMNRLIKKAGCMKVEKNKEFGRHIIATRDIKVGEILLIEKPFVAQLEKDHSLMYCYECLKLCYTMIPCNNCTQVLYCSEFCKDKAFNAYHQYECSVLLTLRAIPNQMILLALKICFMMKNKLSEVLSDTKGQTFDWFKDLYKLETHVDKYKNEDLFGITAAVAGFIHLLKHNTTFFESGVREDDVKETMLNLGMIVSINEVLMTEFALKDVDGRIYESLPFAAGLYSFFSLFNHSCHNNVMYHFHGTSVVLKAANTIKKGEQCFVNYVVHYLNEKKATRQGFLSDSRFFKCRCQACRENWPIEQIIEMETVKHLRIDVLKIHQIVMLLMKYADINDAKNILPHVITKIEKEERISYLSKEYATLRFALDYCYNVLGNKRKI